MRKIYPIDSDGLFEESVKNVKDIMIIINEETLSSLDNSNLQSMTNFDFSMFDNLIKYEIFDHPQLLETFVKNIIDNKANLKMTLDQIEKEYCNGNFNNNPLLKLMLIQFAFGDSANEQMKERGWITSEDMNYRGDYDFAIALPHIYSKGERGDEIHGVEYLVGILPKPIHNQILS